MSFVNDGSFQILQSYLDKFEFYRIKTERIRFNYTTTGQKCEEIAKQAKNNDKYLIGISVWSEYQNGLIATASRTTLNILLGLDSIGGGTIVFPNIPLIPSSQDWKENTWRCVPQCLITNGGVNYFLQQTERFQIQELVKNSHSILFSTYVDSLPVGSGGVNVHVTFVYAHGRFKEGVVAI